MLCTVLEPEGADHCVVTELAMVVGGKGVVIADLESVLLAFGLGLAAVVRTLFEEILRTMPERVVGIARVMETFLFTLSDLGVDAAAVVDSWSSSISMTLAPVPSSGAVKSPVDEFSAIGRFSE